MVIWINSQKPNTFNSVAGGNEFGRRYRVGWPWNHLPGRSPSVEALIII